MSRSRRVAWVYRAPDTSSFRYRVDNMVNSLNASPDATFSAAWFADPDLEALEPLVPHLDALVVARYPAGPAILRLVAQAEHHGVPLIFDCDDLVFDPDLSPMLMDAVAQDLDDPRNWELWYAYTARLQATMRRCQSGITTVEPLRDRMQSLFDSQTVSVLRNFLHIDQQRVSEQLLSVKREGGWARTDDVTIGYFSGTATHSRDFDVVVPALRRLLDKDDRVRLRIVGRIDVPEQLRDLADQIELVDFTDPLSLQRLIAEVEINLAPLQHHPFTACKSELKYFEAAVVGTWTVASDTPAFRDAIDDGLTGRIARAHDWDFALDEAVQLARDPERYVANVEKAASKAYARYGWNEHADDIVACIETAVAMNQQRR